MPSSPEPASAARPRTPVFGAFLEGWRRVLRAPALTASASVATFLLALPLGLAMRDALETHLGPSLEAEHAVSGWHEPWAAEFGAQAQGIGRTFTHAILGFGGARAIVSDLIDRQPLGPLLG